MYLKSLPGGHGHQGFLQCPSSHHFDRLSDLQSSNSRGWKAWVESPRIPHAGAHERGGLTPHPPLEFCAVDSAPCVGRTAGLFDKDNFFGPLAAGQDVLEGRHANTHLAQVGQFHPLEAAACFSRF